jgi:3-hydroxyisobutyrate dehydrogenase
LDTIYFATDGHWRSPDADLREVNTLPTSRLDAEDRLCLFCSDREVKVKVSVLGCGEVGLTYARGLAAAGHDILCCDPEPRQAVHDFCAATGAALHGSFGPWLGQAEVVLSCVVGSLSLSVARSVVPMLAEGSLFIDMTTCDPGDIRIAAREAQERGIAYADVAIMGAIALSGLSTNLLAAGTGAQEAQHIFSAIQAPTRVLVGGAAGDAAAIKILRSVFTKGLEALAVECFIAAEHQGLTDRLYEAMADVDQTPLRDLLEALVRSHVVHAPRRLKEVEEAERQLHKAELPVDVLPGVRARFERTCRALSVNPIATTDLTAAEAFAWLRWA